MSNIHVRLPSGGTYTGSGEGRGAWLWRGENSILSQGIALMLVPTGKSTHQGGAQALQGATW